MTGQEARNDEREALADVLMSDRVMLQPGFGREFALVEADAVFEWMSANGYRKHPEPEITEMVERAVRATWGPSAYLNADQNDARRSTYAADVQRVLEAALRVPVGEGEQ